MRVLVVLVLVVFTGCNASPLDADRQKPKQKEKSPTLFSFSLAVGLAADHTYTDFRRTEFGNAVMEPLEIAAFAAGMFLYTSMQRLPPTTRAIIETSVEASVNLASHVFQHMVKNHLEPMVERAAPVMEEALGQLIQGGELVQDTVSTYITELTERVDPIFQDIQARLHALKKSFVKSE